MNNHKNNKDTHNDELVRQFWSMPYLKKFQIMWEKTKILRETLNNCWVRKNKGTPEIMNVAKRSAWLYHNFLEIWSS